MTASDMPNGRKVRESAILAITRNSAKAEGVLCFRLGMLPGVTAGWPDLVLLAEPGRVLFIETKAPGHKLRPLQEYRREALEALGFDYAVVDSGAQAKTVIAAFAHLTENPA